jgi:hypothetical protein
MLALYLVVKHGPTTDIVYILLFWAIGIRIHAGNLETLPKSKILAKTMQQ